MPPASVCSDLSSVIAFNIPRASISDIEIFDKGFIRSRIPYANLDGETFTWACQTVRVFQSGSLVKPKKDVVGNALRRSFRMKVM